MSAYTINENEYGKYGVYDTPIEPLADDEYEEARFIIDNNSNPIHGTFKEICDTFMNGEFNFNESFQALLADYGEDYIGNLPVEILTKNASDCVITSMSKNELIKDILNNPQDYIDCNIFDNEWLINEARNIANTTLDNPSIEDVFEILNNKSEFFELENHIIITKMEQFVSNSIDLQKEQPMSEKDKVVLTALVNSMDDKAAGKKLKSVDEYIKEAHARRNNENDRGPKNPDKGLDR